ncbi:MAG: hypothetical protein AMJ88_01170 [Anaerolineae bacterium SM23_ 63]|nr:MAG: hypothetical protein AMJ88_01170 [Anaerolineae bacterium SM23_ 63]
MTQLPESLKFVGSLFPNIVKVTEQLRLQYALRLPLLWGRGNPAPIMDSANILNLSKAEMTSLPMMVE